MSRSLLLISATLIFTGPLALADWNDSTSAEMHTVFVFSDPPLAEIYVDGVKQDSPTPAIIRVPANTQPEIEIRSQGHESVKKQIDSRGSGSRIDAELPRKKTKSKSPN